MNIFTKILCLILITFPFLSFASADGTRHPFQQKRLQKKLDEKAQKITIYENVPNREFEDVEVLQAATFLDKNKPEAYLQLQRLALKEEADAIVGVKCKTYGVGLWCTGTAVKWKDSLEK